MDIVKKAFEETLYVVGGMFFLVILMNYLLPINMFANPVFYLFFGLFYFLFRLLINKRLEGRNERIRGKI